MQISFALGSQREPHFQWNIGGVGSPTQNVHVGHVHFMLFMSISFASGTQHKLVFQWNNGLSLREALIQCCCVYPLRTCIAGVMVIYDRWSGAKYRHKTRAMTPTACITSFFLFFYSRLETYSTASRPRLYVAGLPECQPY